MSRRDDMERRIRREAESHSNDCTCTTCKAAAGDQSAMNELLNEVL